MTSRSAPRSRWWTLAAGGLALVAGCTAPAQGSGETSPAAASTSPAPAAGSGAGSSAGSSAAVRAPEADPAARAARSFEAFAVGGAGVRVPWADRVAVQVGDAVVRELAPRQAARRASWQGCPPGEATYEGRDCPVSLLQPLADLHGDDAAPVQESVWPRTVGCSRVPASALPGGGDSVVLRPPTQRRDCFSDFAVMVQLDDAGRVSGVALALSGP